MQLCFNVRDEQNLLGLISIFMLLLFFTGVFGLIASLFNKKFKAHRKLLVLIPIVSFLVILSLNILNRILFPLL